jgi:hypothetical protein
VRSWCNAIPIRGGLPLEPGVVGRNGH